MQQPKRETGRERLQAPEKQRRFFEVRAACQVALKMEAVCFPERIQDAPAPAAELSTDQLRGAAFYDEHRRRLDYQNKLDSVAWERMRTTLEPAVDHQPIQYTDQPEHELQPELADLADRARQTIAGITNASPKVGTVTQLHRPNVVDQHIPGQFPIPGSDKDEPMAA